MMNVRCNFEEYEGEPAHLVGYHKIKCNIVWNMTLGKSITRKSRFITGGHIIETPSFLIYSSVVLKYSIQIALTIAALHDFDILGYYIKNAYLSAPCKEMIYMGAGLEFGSDAGKLIKVVCAFYGLKISKASFRSMLANCICNMDYCPRKSDPSVWIKSTTKVNGFKYYNIVLCYLNVVVSIGESSMRAIKEVKSVFKLKGDKTKISDM